MSESYYRKVSEDAVNQYTLILGEISQLCRDASSGNYRHRSSEMLTTICILEGYINALREMQARLQQSEEVLNG